MELLEQPPMNDLRLFVYGSLKVGECNDFVLTRWLREYKPAQTLGEMRLRPDNYPSMFLPSHGRLGTKDYHGDLKLAEAPSCDEGQLIKGQMLYLSDGAEALPVLDRFEGYFPGEQSEYLRVAISVSTKSGWVPCWTYTGVGPPVQEWPRLEVWPPPGLSLRPEPYEHGLQ